MVFGGLADDGWFRQFNEQARALNSFVNLSGFNAVQQISKSYGSQWARIDEIVESMRMPLSSFSAAAQAAALVQPVYTSQMVAGITAASEAVKGFGQSAVIHAAHIFASFPTSLFESLRRSQEMWFQAIRYSEDFLRLQQVLGTNLAQLLSEHADHYQAMLDGRDAFAQAFAICHIKLHFCALKILKNTHDAEDALQDAAEKALLALPTYSTEKLHHLNVEGWLMAIVKRTALNQKRDGSRCISSVPSWLEQRSGSRLEQPEAHLLRRELFQAVHEGFRALSAWQRKIILLRYFNFGAEMTWEELACHLGGTSTNARVSYTRGLAIFTRPKCC